MNSIDIRSPFLFAATLAFVAIGPTCRADLFALKTGSGGIVRMDSTTGAVIDTYPTLDVSMSGPISVDSGLAFDGRNLYLNHFVAPGFEELWQFNLASESWFPYGILETVSINPPDAPRITGLGYMPDAFGQPGLVAVTRRQSGQAYVVQYSLNPPFLNGAPMFPAGEFPAEDDPRGVDFDPATGEIWMTAFTGTPSGLPTINRIALDGSILQSLPGPVDAPFDRGVGFDAGGLFIAGRDVVASQEMIYHINRTTGAVLNSFVIPGSGTVAALTGGTVIPEPASVALLMIGLMAGESLSRKRWGFDRRQCYFPRIDH